MKKLIVLATLLVAGALLGYQIWGLPKTVEAGAVDACDYEHTYGWNNNSTDVDDFRLVTNIHSSDNNETISVTAKSGYQVIDLDLDGDFNGSGTDFSGGNRDHFNPSGIGVIARYMVTVKKVCASPSPSVSPSASPSASPAQCKHENSECEINNSEKACCAGLTCVPFNDQSGNYKCEQQASSSPSASPSASASASPSVEPSNEPEESRNPESTPTDNGDVCDNIDGIQTGVPEGKHLDASGLNCVNYELGGAPVSEGTSSNGQVLGASTMAGTGVAEENLFNLIFALGSLLSAFGIRKFTSSRVK